MPRGVLLSNEAPGSGCTPPTLVQDHEPLPVHGETCVQREAKVLWGGLANVKKGVQLNTYDVRPCGLRQEVLEVDIRPRSSEDAHVPAVRAGRQNGRWVDSGSMEKWGVN